MKKEQFKAHLLSKHAIRVHFFFILLGVTLSGMLLNRGLLNLGVQSLFYRNLWVIPACYGIFFILVRVWITWMEVDRPQPGLTLEIPDSNRSNIRMGRDWWADLGFLDLFSEGAGFVIGIGVLILGLGLWIGVEGPIILVDAAFEAALSARLIQATREVPTSGWSWTVFKRTFLIFIGFWIASSAILSYAEERCPGRTRFSEVVRQCWLN
jgi:hypothetical protein